ncbi:hypothetical protein NHX12_030853 [Muraenolepis orangiensis]|uniref:Uncharacterized protein n=1 Tax=Muraenolepis orangiensis TaxID=630683 RepID=A0A9Q0E915_9TELE|nr:hypothetical protein NHX12_030853 [Muraenolepis orangiensis]
MSIPPTPPPPLYSTPGVCRFDNPFKWDDCDGCDARTEQISADGPRGPRAVSETEPTIPRTETQAQGASEAMAWRTQNRSLTHSLLDEKKDGLILLSLEERAVSKLPHEGAGEEENPPEQAPGRSATLSSSG